MNFSFLKNPSQQRLGITLAFGALLWSGTYNALAKGLTPFLSPMSLLILSEALTGVFIVLTFGFVPLLKEFAKMDAASIRMSAIVGLFNSALSPMLWFTGLSMTSAVNASMLSSAEILCVLVLGYFMLGERLLRMQIIGALVVFAGVLIINLGTEGQSLTVHFGDLFVLAGAIVSGMGAVLFKKHISHVMPELSILIRNITGIAAILLVSLFLRYSFIAEVQAFPIGKVALLVAFTFFSRYLNLTFFYEALDRLPASTMSLIEIGAPLSGLVFAFLILGERIYSYQVLGCIFIIFGLVLEQISEQAFTRIRRQSLIGRLPHFGFSKQTSIAETEPLSILPKA